MNEIWKDIKGYEKLYQISNQGRVRSHDRMLPQENYIRGFKGKIMSSTDNGYGYLIISLIKSKKRKNHYVHRLVAEAFIGEIPNGYVVNHRDYNKKNNHVDNLEIITQKENTIYSAHKMSKPRIKFKLSATGEKHIYYRGKKYRLCIPSQKVDRQFPSLSEAVSYREVVLSGE